MPGINIRITWYMTMPIVCQNQILRGFKDFFHYVKKILVFINLCLGVVYWLVQNTIIRTAV